MTKSSISPNDGIERREAAPGLQDRVYRAISGVWREALSATDQLVFAHLCRIAQCRNATGFTCPVKALCSEKVDGFDPLKVSTGKLRKSLRWLREVGLVAERPTPNGTLILIDFDRLLAAEDPMIEPLEALKRALWRPDKWA